VSAARRGDAASRTSVKVTIVGDEYTLRSDAPEAHTRRRRRPRRPVIRQVMSTGSVVETHKAAILAALQIADELLRARATRTPWPSARRPSPPTCGAGSRRPSAATGRRDGRPRRVARHRRPRCLSRDLRLAWAVSKHRVGICQRST
jgi:hypothetical protein